MELVFLRVLNDDQISDLILQKYDTVLICNLIFYIDQ